MKTKNHEDEWKSKTALLIMKKKNPDYKWLLNKGAEIERQKSKEHYLNKFAEKLREKVPCFVNVQTEEYNLWEVYEEIIKEILEDGE